MLVALSIHDFVLIDRLALSPVDGFTALTGETGAGKSIILDALSVALGGLAERRMIRRGEPRAGVSAVFSLAGDHRAWALLEEAGLAFDRDEALTLKRLIPEKGAIRAMVNDQPVSAGLLRQIGDTLVDLHGQHAAMALTKPQSHRAMLDDYARNGDLLARCADAWTRVIEAQAAREALESAQADSAETLARLEQDLAAIDEVDPIPGEASSLAAERAVLSQGERLRDGLAEADGALSEGSGRDGLAQAARAVERLCRLPGLEAVEGQEDAASTSRVPAALRQLSEGLERSLIELDEAEAVLATLRAGLGGGDGRLETVEARLFAIRGLARRFQVEPDDLGALRERLAAERACLDAGEDAVAVARASEADARARWRTIAQQITTARKAAARRLETAVRKELKPLKMAATELRFAITQQPDANHGSTGQDRVEIEVQTTKGAGFGPLVKIASGGELARVSLALRCALADVGQGSVLVFDEADQGVGGAVAAAIGERLTRLGGTRQVFAVTHSPQVAAAADDQWRIAKSGAGSKGDKTSVARLDEAARLEEVARMLSGHNVTPEARQAAARLLEAPCQGTSP